MSQAKPDDTFAEISHIVWQHLVERGWDDPAPEPRSLAISLSLEANELLEHYQWSKKPVGNKEDLGEELADILIYALQYAHVIGVDPASIIRDKLAKSALKYPAENFKGIKGEDRSKAWLEAKMKHRENKKSL
ncbi:MAG TPA: MazG-like family protein [Candidatus Saccharimonadales bacterium]|nr:MazG-like family protein [Candidatus Saccharimonadales bacterium]